MIINQEYRKLLAEKDVCVVVPSELTCIDTVIILLVYEQHPSTHTAPTLN